MCKMWYMMVTQNELQFVLFILNNEVIDGRNHEENGVGCDVTGDGK